MITTKTNLLLLITTSTTNNRGKKLGYLDSFKQQFRTIICLFQL